MNHVLDDTLSRITEAGGYHGRAPEFGERAWRIKGRLGDIVYRGVGNGWCDVIGLLPKEDCDYWVQGLFATIEAGDDA